VRLLLVTSTQLGQQALDGPPGQHSPDNATLVRDLAWRAALRN
jgi:hypothetical protein